MHIYNNLALVAHQRRAEMLREAEQQRLAAIAQGAPRRFRLIGWRLPALLHLGLLNREPVSNRKLTRRTAADHI